MNLLEVKNICKTYGSGETAVKALRNVSFSVPKGEYVAIVGESGSGKSTLLNMVGALDVPTSGKVLIDGKDIFSMNDRKMCNVVYAYENGKLFRCWNAHGEINKEEVLYVHFQKRNMNVDLQQEEENSFLIVPDRFVDYKDLTQQLMKQLAPNKITSKNIIESTKQVIRNIVK